MKFFQELKRRNVFRVGVAYLVASWLLLQIADVVLSLLDLPVIAGQMIFLLLAFGFIPALIFAWAFELTPDGIKRDREVGTSESIAGDTGRTLDRIILFGAKMLLFKVSMLWWKRVHQSLYYRFTI
jgi:hypothetical protein